MLENTKAVETTELTAEEWEELGEALLGWAIYGPFEEWRYRESRKPVDMCIKMKYGIVKKESYIYYDLLENRLAYLTVKNISNIPDFVEKTKIYSIRGIEHTALIYENNVDVPYYLLQKPYGLEHLNRVQGEDWNLYEKIIRLCTKYLRSIGVEIDI